MMNTIKKAMLTDDIKQMLIKKGLGDVDIAADYGAGGDRVISELKSKGIKGIRKSVERR